MTYEQDISSCLSDAIGSGGLGRAQFDSLLAGLIPAFEALRAHHADNSLPLLRLPELDDVAGLAKIAAEWREKFDSVLVLGTGGSSLGGKTLCALVQDDFGTAPGAPRLYFLENVDPHGFDRTLVALELDRTGLLVISKSGGTTETLTQLFLCLSAWKAAGIDNLPGRFLAISEPGENVLRAVCDRENIPVLDHDPKIGGRYSALSLVGVLPALMAGLDGEALRRGAGAVLRPILDGADPSDVAPAIGAAVSVGLATQNGVSQTVLMPYIDRLASFSKWCRQLWAESLGKDGRGTTPIDALGTVDQHSQLQLYLDGPRDKMFTVIMLDRAGAGGRVDPVLAKDPALDYLAGRTMGDLIDAEQRAMAQTLIDCGRPTRIFRLEALNEETLGALMMHFMLETILAAHLFGIDPFDQPAVEQGKILTRQYLAETGST